MSTYTPIQTITVPTATASVTFGAIPQTYTDLVMTWSGGSSVETAATLRFNGDTTSSYGISYLYGTGTNPVAAGIEPNLSVLDAFYVNNAQNAGIAHINNYSNTTTNKTVLTRSSSVGGASLVISYVGMWRNRSAIQTITVQLDSGTINAGTVISLYGISAKESASAKAYGGNSIYTDGTYWYHVFTSSGTFVPQQPLTCDYLVVAGGGGGGSQNSAGGGAGGLRSTVTATGGGGSLESPISLAASTNYVITVGGGGAYLTSPNRNGGNGNDSSISGSGLTTITSMGGGGGAGGTENQGYTGNSGGSGGGGGGTSAGGSRAAGTGQSGQGFAGEPGVATFSGGGGGGAGQAGGATGTRNGGNGVTVAITGSSVTYGGGGGGLRGFNDGAGTGGSGGTGGGGQGGRFDDSSTTAGAANTGGGGGAGQNALAAPKGQGGSGIVIVRYAA